MDAEKLISDLEDVLKKHGVWFSGSVRLRDLSNNEWDKNTVACGYSDVEFYGPIKDNGPFLKFSVAQVEVKKNSETSLSKITLVDKDKLLKDGVKSPIDGKSVFTNRHGYGEHLKRHGCVEIGNDFNAPKHKPLEGDFNPRKELTEAVHQIGDKYGIRD